LRLLRSCPQSPRADTATGHSGHRDRHAMAASIEDRADS
jgi:hypothetical protein